VRHALAAAGVLLALAGTAAAEDVALGPATIELDAAWTGEAPVTGTSPVLVRKNGGAVLTVSRLPAPNPGAWRSSTRDAYIGEIEAGLVAGATKLAAKRKKLGTDNVNVLDVTLRRTGPAGPEVVAVRVLLFRTLTMAAAAAAPDTRGNRKLVETAVSGLLPTAR
jgi:hypothetical protein